eukprot:574433-Hanusia_phi.AAC.1
MPSSVAAVEVRPAVEPAPKRRPVLRTRRNANHALKAEKEQQDERHVQLIAALQAMFGKRVAAAGTRGSAQDSPARPPRYPRHC